MKEQSEAGGARIRIHQKTVLAQHATLSFTLWLAGCADRFRLQNQRHGKPEPRRAIVCLMTGFKRFWVLSICLERLRPRVDVLHSTSSLFHKGGAKLCRAGLPTINESSNLRKQERQKKKNFVEKRTDLRVRRYKPRRSYTPPVAKLIGRRRGAKRKTSKHAHGTELKFCGILIFWPACRLLKKRRTRR